MRGGASVCMERGISARRRYAALRVARTGALDERGHGGGDHPVPFRTRQLSPPSPDVLRGKPVGGRAAALAQRARTRAPAHRRPRHARGLSRSPAMRSDPLSRPAFPECGYAPCRFASLPTRPCGGRGRFAAPFLRASFDASSDPISRRSGRVRILHPSFSAHGRAHLLQTYGCIPCSFPYASFKSW